uniref:Macroglobulin domain-containing protein n=1 Tax=Labrus bergylta TaxID=56723 RepID=A0A3Q3EN42_9LABR
GRPLNVKYFDAQFYVCRQFMVTIPAVIGAGAETSFCASLLKPNETLVMTVTLRSLQQNVTLMEETSSQEFHTCIKFMAPLVQDEVRMLEVEVRGATFYSKEVRKVMIRAYQPSTFVQTDKPIYLPGQTVNFRVVSLDSKLRPVNRLVSDSASNRVGQWLQKESNGTILQLSYSLNSEAREGTYNVIVSIGDEKIFHNFKVEKYVLPRFEVKVEAPGEVSIGHEDIKVEVCAKYTYGQPVPGNVKIEMHRPLSRYYTRNYVATTDNSDGVPEITAPSYMEIKQSFNTEKRLDISYVIGKVFFMDTPKIYNKGSDVEGKVSARSPLMHQILYTVQPCILSRTPLCF